MANPEHLARLQEGVDEWNKWRRKEFGGADAEADPRRFTIHRVDLVEVDLSEADLRGVDLRWADLTHTSLRKANLHGASLNMANLTLTHLYEANLTGANLHGATLSMTLLNGANLHSANLSFAEFSYADLDATDFNNAIFHGTSLGSLDLSVAKGLDQARHLSPSTIGIDTIYKSKAQIPEQFLRGAGVPDNFIAFAKSLVTNPIEYYSCFISHSSHDQAFADRLVADLRARGLSCWYAPEDLKIGDRFQERIEESIRLFDKVMIVLSEASAQSRWVEREVDAAREREDRENCTVLFPIRIDDTVMNAPQAWAADLRRTRHIGDFREWEVDASYLKAFDRLLHNLKATDQA